MEQKLKEIDTAKALLIGVVIAVVYYFALFDDGSSLEMSINTTQASITQKTTEIASMKKTLEDAKKHAEISAKIGAELEQVLQAVPESYNSVELMKLISNEAKVVGANILSVKGNDVKLKDTDEASFAPIRVDVDLTGTFNQIMLFLSNMTKVSKVILMKTINIQGAKNTMTSSTASPSLSFKASFEAYRYVPDSARGKKKGGR